MLCQTPVRPPHDTKTGCWESRCFRTYVCPGRGICDSIAGINAASTRAPSASVSRRNAYWVAFSRRFGMAERATTDKQQRILDVIRQFTSDRGFPPSVREIGERVGLSSSSTVQSHLKTLERRGLLKRDPTKPRALVATRSDDEPQTIESITLPVVGRVAAGVPITASENLEDQFVLPASWAPRTGGFVLRVECVAMIDEEATVIRLYREHGSTRLQPENASMAPIYADDVTIGGRVEALSRK